MATGMSRFLTGVTLLLVMGTALWGQEGPVIRIVSKGTPAPAAPPRVLVLPDLSPAKQKEPRELPRELPPELPKQLPSTLTDLPPVPPPVYTPPPPPVHAAPAPPAHLTLPPGSPSPEFLVFQPHPRLELVPATPPPVPSHALWNWGDGVSFWVRTEALQGTVRSQPLPPLATLALPGTPRGLAGNLGTPGTSVVLGDRGANSDPRSGGRFGAGFWFDRDQTIGLEVDSFFLSAHTDTLTASFDGTRPLARPFYNAQFDRQDALLVAFPGELTGQVQARASASALYGAGALLRENLFTGQDGAGRVVWRMDILGGYRFLNIAEGLSIQQDMIRTTEGPSNGSQIAIRDSFHTSNQFHGCDIGLVTEYRHGGFWVELKTKLAAGYTNERVSILGGRVATNPDGSLERIAGGLLAQSSNIGVHNQSRAAIVPELGLTLGWDLFSNLRLTTGYDLLYVSNVVRPGDHVDLGVNPSLADGGGGPVRPAFAFRSSDLWLQGLRLGLELRY